MPTYAVSDIAASLVVLSLVFAAAALIRRQVAVLRDLFLPASVVGGFLTLLVGPQVLGKLTGIALIPAQTAEIWSRFPSLLINVIFASLLLGKALPSIGDMWRASSGHVALGYGLSFGQYMVGSAVTLLLLVPVFGMAPESAALIEVAFTGGHGTAAGLSGSFADAGAPYLTDVALGLATVGLVSGVVVGSMLVRWAVASRKFSIAREEPFTRADDRDIDRAHDYEAPQAANDDAPDAALGPLTAAVMFIGLSIFAGWLLLEGLRAIENALTGQIRLMSEMPLFPMTIIGGMIVQFATTKMGLARLIDRRRVNEVSGVALDALILTAIGTMSLAAIGSNLAAIVVISAAAIGWSVFCVLILAPRLFNIRWFENAMGDFGQSQGTIATGFMLIDMADPRRTTGASESFGYKQLLFEPFVGGGFITAMAVPAIHFFGAPAMLAVSTVATVLVLLGGARLARGSRTA
jgi:ESS family glutamate:Na+ symporter